IPRRIRNVDRGGPGLHGCLNHIAQEAMVRTTGVLRAELDVIRVRERQLHGFPCHPDDRPALLGERPSEFLLPELGVDVDIARGDERVDPRSLASLQSLACGLDVSGKRTSQSTDNGPVYLLNDTRHGLELSGRRDRKSGLDYIHIETGQLLRE